MTTRPDLHPPLEHAASPTVGHRIVVGVDGSPTSIAALRWAAEQARLSQSRLEAVLVFAPAPPMFFAVGGYPAVNPVDAVAVRKRARRVLEDTVDAALGSRDDVRLLAIADPSPAKALTRLAGDADMLVVGAHRHTAMGLVLGSTATSCVRHASSPVVVVPADGHDPHPAPPAAGARGPSAG